jgi:tetratricopeptide (TPR) repeat protein
LIILATISQGEGKLNDAVEKANEAREIAHKIPNIDLEAYALSALALAKSESGNLSGALEDCNSLLKMRENNPAARATTLRRMGTIYLRMGRFPEARKAYQDALQSYGPLQQPMNAAQTSLDLAEINFSEGDFSNAEAKAVEALKIFTPQSGKNKDEDANSQADALALLIRAMVKQGPSRLPDAEDRLKTLTAITVTDLEVKSDVALGEGTVKVADGRAKDAIGPLDTAADTAVGLGQQFISLQLRLLAVEAREKAGDHTGAKNALTKLRDAARQLHFTLISDQAAALAHSAGL